jgi:hypothetical protein
MIDREDFEQLKSTYQNNPEFFKVLDYHDSAIIEEDEELKD